MDFKRCFWFHAGMICRWSCLLLLVTAPWVGRAQTTVPVVVATNTTVRIMAANLTSGNNQRYEGPGLRIMEGLKPDIVAIQEFNYLNNNFRGMVDTAFGTNFVYYRESGSYSIPNGIISRYPIIASGSWVDSDTGVNDRGFAWARIDIPGTNDLYVISVHLKASSGTENQNRRNAQATEIKNLILSNFPANAWIVVAGDFNTFSRTEPCMATFKTFLSDARVPVDQAGIDGTNRSREEPYDHVMPNFLLSSNRVATVLGAHSFVNGLVFDSRVYTPLPSPVLVGDSGAVNMQHMAVVKDFNVPYSVTNFMAVTAPTVVLQSTNVLRWVGQSNVTYTVQGSTNLLTWNFLGTTTSSGTNNGFTNLNVSGPRQYYRVKYP